MEPRFGTRFGQVRVHQDETSSSLAQAIGARAFTVHNNVFFKRGEYEPSTKRGQRLQKMTGHTYDLGTSGPNNNGVDGKYGSKTAAAVMQFKADEKLGSTQYGDVGPGVMHHLDELFRVGPTPPSPTPPSPTPPQICGPDVTQETAAALAHTQSAFGGWYHNMQEQACDELDSGGLLIPAKIAWDIIELHNQDWLDAYSNNGCATPAQPHPCARTVTVMRGSQAQCWYPGSVNYVIFGTMCRLCLDAGYLRWTENYMKWLIQKYKPSSANLQESLDWASAGYARWSASSGPVKGDRQQCSPTCGLPLTIAFHVAWRPHSTQQSPTI